MSLLNVGSAIALYLFFTTIPAISFLGGHDTINVNYGNDNSIGDGTRGAGGIASPLTISLLFFNNLNIFIALCEICLGRNISYIQHHYKKLRSLYSPGNEWQACLSYLTMPLRIAQLFTNGNHWMSQMWSTYALYDPSYQNQESFGFFIDYGNGLSTIPPSIFMQVAILFPNKVSALWVGCVGLAMYWQVLYGTIIYILSFVFNKRYEGKSTLEVCLFVGVSNSLWFFFPLVGIYSCVCMLKDGNMEVFQRS